MKGKYERQRKKREADQKEWRRRQEEDERAREERRRREEEKEEQEESRQRIQEVVSILKRDRRFAQKIVDAEGRNLHLWSSQLSPVEVAEVVCIAKEEVSVTEGLVFISYCREDLQHLQVVQRALTEARIKTWTDQGFEPGTPLWQQEIESAIDRASCVIALLSPDAKRSKWVRQETAYAGIQERPVLPLLIAGSEADSIPVELAQTNFTDARGDRSSDAVVGLVDVVRRLLGE